MFAAFELKKKISVHQMTFTFIFIGLGFELTTSCL
jgi:hypothetical protein